MTHTTPMIEIEDSEIGEAIRALSKKHGRGFGLLPPETRQALVAQYLKEKRTCRQCPHPVADKAWVTCGQSECQEKEAAANAQRAKTRRKKRS